MAPPSSSERPSTGVEPPRISVPPSQSSSISHINRSSLLSSSARFLEEVRGQWPDVPTLSFDRPSIHTISQNGSPAASLTGPSTPATPLSSKMATTPTANRAATQHGVVPYHYPLRADNAPHLITPTRPINPSQRVMSKNGRGADRISWASSARHRDSDALEDLLLEHETVVQEVHRQSSQDSLSSAYDSMPTTNNAGEEAVDSSASERPLVKVPSSRNPRKLRTPRSPNTRQVVFKASTANPKMSSRGPQARPELYDMQSRDDSARPNAFSHPRRPCLSPIVSVDTHRSPATSLSSSAEMFPPPPLLPALLASELPSRIELARTPPRERFAILADIFSVMVKGSQANVQQLGNRTVRLKRELRARVEEMKTYEIRSRQLDATLITLESKMSHLQQEAEVRSITSTKKNRLFSSSSLGWKNASSEPDLALKGKEAHWSDEASRLVHGEAMMIKREMKAIENEKVAVEGEILHHKNRVRVIESQLPSFEQQVDAASKKFAALRELETTLRSLRISCGLDVEAEEEEDFLVATLSSSLQEQNIAVDKLRRHERQYEKMIESEDYLNVAISAAERLANVLIKMRQRAEELSQRKGFKRRTKPNSSTSRGENADCKETATWRAVWVEAWQGVYSSLTKIRGNINFLLGDNSTGAMLVRKMDSLQPISTTKRVANSNSNSVTWATMPRVERSRGNSIVLSASASPSPFPESGPEDASLPSSTNGKAREGKTNDASPSMSYTTQQQSAVPRSQSNGSMTSIASFQTAKSKSSIILSPSIGLSTSPRASSSLPIQRTLNDSPYTPNLQTALEVISILFTTLGPLVPPRVLTTPLRLPAETMAQHSECISSLTSDLEKLRSVWDDTISLYEEAGEKLAKILVGKMKECDERKSEWWSREGERAVSGFAM